MESSMSFVISLNFINLNFIPASSLFEKLMLSQYDNDNKIKLNMYTLLKTFHYSAFMT